MTHGHRTGRQESARRRRRQQRLIKIGAVVIVAAIAVAAAMVTFTGGDDSSPSTTAQRPAAKSAATWDTEAFTGGPRLAVDRVTHDEGSIPYGHEVQASFQLRNVGDQSLTLGELSVNTLEGC